MPKGDIQFHIEEGTELSSLGAKSIEMLFSANKGEQLLPLHKVASGGELARIALAFKSVFRSDAFKTMVFDEIDVGISGDIALKVAEKYLIYLEQIKYFVLPICLKLQVLRNNTIIYLKSSKMIVQSLH